MGLLVFFIWRTMKLMPRTKPQQIKPESASSIRWDDVAGADEAKAELAEVVEFLRDPKRFAELGATVPKGILLHGPPGTGKTLLAKAVACESGAQFFSQSAASFVEMFAGLGAARIRRLFAEARKARPAIIFIDELDAVGAKRGSDNNSEREQTLNQLLVEMDGFDTAGDLVVIAASNLLEKLDTALLRPGRFDRQILVSPPGVAGREEILKVHTRNKPLASNCDLATLARQTSGLAGADLANICNEAAIFAARARRRQITQADFDDAVERVVAGMQSRRALTEHERRVVAWHEAGHALCAELLPGVDRVHKISIVPRGSALGYTLNLPEEDRYLKTREELIDHMTVLLGGRVAEEIVFGAVTTGASNDLHRVAEISRSMIHDYAMGTSITSRKVSAHGGEVSDRTRELRDDEQQHLADEAKRAATQADRRAPRQARRARRAAPAQRGARARRHRADHGRHAALPPRRGRPARRRGRPQPPRSAAGDQRVGVALHGHALQPGVADLAVRVELRAGRDVDLDHVAAVVLHPALLGDRVALEPPGAAREAEARAGRDDATSSTPSSGSAAPTAEPPPNAPVTARMTCQAPPENTVAAVDAHRALAAARRSPRPRDRADAVGQRAEPRLERRRPAGGDRGEPGARDVHERPPVAEPAELELAQPLARDRQRRRPRRGRAGARSRARSRSPSRRGSRRAARRAAPRAPRPRRRSRRRRRRRSARAPRPGSRSRSSGSQPHVVTSAPCSRMARSSGAGSVPAARGLVDDQRDSHRRRGVRVASPRVFTRIDHVGIAVADLDAADRRCTSASTACRSSTARPWRARAWRPCCSTWARATSSCCAPLADDTPVGRFLARRGPGPAPRRLRRGGHRGGARARSRRRASG